MSIGYSDNWYDYYHYDEAVCGVAPNEYLIHTPCQSSCNRNGFCARTFKNRVLEAYYYYADVSSVRICLYQEEIGQYPPGTPETCSDNP